MTRTEIVTTGTAFAAKIRTAGIISEILAPIFQKINSEISLHTEYPHPSSTYSFVFSVNDMGICDYKRDSLVSFHKLGYQRLEKNSQIAGMALVLAEKISSFLRQKPQVEKIYGWDSIGDIDGNYAEIRISYVLKETLKKWE